MSIAMAQSQPIGNFITVDVIMKSEHLQEGRAATGRFRSRRNFITVSSSTTWTRLVALFFDAREVVFDFFRDHCGDMFHHIFICNCIDTHQLLHH